MTNNLLGELNMMDHLDIKPNYAALGRKYGMDWRTVKKYHEGYKGKPATRNKPSKLDKYKIEIRDKFKIKRINVKAVYEFMVSKYGADEIGSYSNFITYVKANKLKPKASSSTGHPRVELLPGEQAQVDWKEDIRLCSKYGETFTINVFHITFSFSRYSYLELTLQKRSEDVIRCLINSFNAFGGVPKEILFDNMSTVANVRVKPKKPTEAISRLGKDFNFKVRLCAARSPETKGTVEAKNKVIDWIRAYEHEFEELKDLEEIVKNINSSMNISVNADIGMSPTALFYKEKEYLQSLPSKRIVSQYLCPNRYRVSNDALIRYGNGKYSVDPKLINEEVTVDYFENNLYIYYKGKLVTYHPIIGKKINYKEEHYKKLMDGKVKESDLEERVHSNLKIMDSLLELRKVDVSVNEAARSEQALIAFINQNPCGRWVINAYNHLNNKEKKTFIKGMNSVLPHVKDKDIFIEHIKYSMKTNLCETIDYDCYIHDLMAYSEQEQILSDEGYGIIQEKYNDEIDAFLKSLGEDA